MATQCYAPVRGRVIRVTRLDGCGNPLPGESAVSVSKQISSVAIEEVTEDGTNIRDRNFGDELCVVDDAFTDIIGYSSTITFCGVDPDLISAVSGQPVVLDASGDVVGFSATTGIDLDSFGFALEVWSRLAGQQCDPSGNRYWGYTVFPFLKGGRLGGFSFENAAVTFSVAGAQTRDGSGWGAGPFDVMLGEDDTPSPLLEPIGAREHFRSFRVAVDPPEPSCGATALAPVGP